ncbi:MAG: leucine-rich repeat domain-containing protein [Flavobacteriales bacterium]
MKNIHPLGIDLPYSDSIPIYRKFQKLTLTFLLLLTFSFVSAQTFVLDSLKYTAIDSSNIMVEKAGNYPTGELNIPNTVIDPNTNMQYTVRSIADTAFALCSAITSISIGDSLNNIGISAFYGCASLVTLSIPDSLTSIGEGAFEGCSALESVVIPEFVSVIEEGAFEGCSSLDSINIPNSVTTIGEGAFASCSGLTSVAFGDSITSIGKSAFAACSSLDSISIPNSVTTIGDSAFAACSALTTAAIGDSVSTIGNEAFEECIALESISIPNSITSIGDAAFKSCSALDSISIPKSVTNIGQDAFASCSALTEVSVSWDTPLMITADVFSEVVLSSIILKVPSSTIYLYEASNVWQNFNSISAVHNLVETACGGFELGDSTYTSSGMYTETLSTAENNDSIVNLALTILENTSSNVMLYGQCVNFNGVTYMENIDTTITLVNSVGCDSIVSLSVFISQSDSFLVSTIIEICEGETVQDGDSTFSEEGTFTQAFMGVNCLDSIVIISIIITPKPIISNPQDLLLETAQDYVSYQWLKDGNEINGATSFQYNATENGNYQVEAINDSGCVVLSESYNINSIDIKESALGRFMVYPNPTSSNATIQVPFAEEFNMELTNVLGEIVLSQKLVNTETVLQISEFNKGIYFINLFNEKGNQTLRFVKN